MKVNTLKLNDPGYPDILTTIQSPPQQLFYRGESPSSWLAKPKVAVVGSRKMTPYGKAVTAKLVSELARSGVVIISGLAYGVDAAAHRAALDASGIAVAVLGNNIEHIAPAGNYSLGLEILTNKGTILSEYSDGHRVFASNFVIRNRIVSGLCDVLLVTEAGLKSGSLHTARFALEQGKTVMAVPGNITSMISEGCNNLIKSGAIPVTEAGDIFFALKIDPQKLKSRPFSGTPEAQKLLQLIREGLSDQEDLALASRLDGPTISSNLTMLEITGHIRPTGAGHWAAT